MSGESAILDGVLCVDRRSQVTLINPPAQALLGINALAALGHSLADLSGHPELIGPLRTDHDGVAVTRDEVARTLEVHHTERDLLYIRAISTPMRDHEGEFAGVITYLHDITTGFKSNQLKNQYLSIVAHELRTPLTGIKTFATMLGKSSLGDLNERQAEAASAIREQSLRLEQQIDKLINLGYLDDNDYGQDLQVIAVPDLIRNAVAPFEALAAEGGVRLAVGADADVEIRADRADLRRAIQAFVENALKFTPDGGLVEVTTTSEGDEVRISIRDDGIGVDPRYQRRIFEKFFQVEDPLTRHHGGAGLGLFVASEIIAAHGSRIELASELGKGADFCFRLPTYKEDASADAGDAAPGAAPEQVRT